MRALRSTLALSSRTRPRDPSDGMSEVSSCARRRTELPRRRAGGSMDRGKTPRTTSLEIHLVAALELEHLARVLGRCDLEAQAPRSSAATSFTCSAFDLASRPGPAQRLSSRPTRTLPPMRDRLRGDGQLVAAGTEHAPLVLVAEQAVGGALHVRHVLRVRADAAEDAEHRLDEERRLDDAAVGEMAQRIEMADVVALDLEARVVLRRTSSGCSRCR